MGFGGSLFSIVSTSGAKFVGVRCAQNLHNCRNAHTLVADSVDVGRTLPTPPYLIVDGKDIPLVIDLGNALMMERDQFPLVVETSRAGRAGFAFVNAITLFSRKAICFRPPSGC